MGKLTGEKLRAKITSEITSKLPAKFLQKLLGMSAAQQNFHSTLCAIHTQLAGKMLLFGDGRQVFHRPLLAGRRDRR